MFEENSPQKEQKDVKKIATRYLIPGLGIIALLSLVFAGSLYVAKYHPNVLGLSSENSQQPATAEEIEKLVKKVGDLILLPPGETPTVATVNDLTQVRTQDFFKNAEVGDKVLIYTNSKKAYLYRPSSHKLIEVGIVNQDNPTQAVGGVQDSAPAVITPTPFPTSVPIDEILDETDPSPSPDIEETELLSTPTPSSLLP